jgi:hypothetical protein
VPGIVPAASGRHLGGRRRSRWGGAYGRILALGADLHEELVSIALEDDLSTRLALADTHGDDGVTAHGGCADPTIAELEHNDGREQSVSTPLRPLSGLTPAARRAHRWCSTTLRCVSAQFPRRDGGRHVQGPCGQLVQLEPEP